MNIIWVLILLGVLVAAAFAIIAMGPMPLDNEDLEDWEEFNRKANK